MDVLTFGGRELQPVSTMVAKVVGRVAWLGVLDAASCEDLCYQETGLALDAAIGGLSEGRLCSIQLRQEEPEHLLLGLYAPRFAGSVLDEWTCVVEAREEILTPFFELATQCTGLDFVALTVDEQPEFTTAYVTKESFPWDDWRLKKAAVLGESGTWEQRVGPLG